MGGQETEWLVIGGSGGIGREIVLHAALQGAYVRCTGGSRRGIAGLRGEFLQRNAADGRGCMPDARVRRITGMRSLVRLERWVASLPLPDVVVCAYGPLFEGRLEDTSAADWHLMALHNLVLPGMLLSQLLPRMQARGSGTIILFGGTDTDQIKGYRQIAAYSAVKTGVGVLARSAAKTVPQANGKTAASDVRTVCICPDFVETEYLTDDQRRRYRSLAGADGLSLPQRYARLAWRIAQREENFPNGAILNMRIYRE